MGFLFARSAGKQVPAITGLQIQTAVNVLPIALIYGMPRTQMNIIYVNGFKSVVSSSSGGKGLLSGGKGAPSQTKYYATFIGAIGEGILGPPAVIFDNQAVYTLSTAPFQKGVAAFFPGSTTQAAWSSIVSRWPADAFAYKDTCYLGFEDYLLDSSATIPLLGFVSPGKFQGTSPLNQYTAPDGQQFYMDADPALVIYDFLTNPTYGATFPTAYVDQSTLFTSSDGFDPLVGDAALSTYCQAVGLGWSLIINNFEPASSILSRWCKNLVVAPVWTGSTLKFVPYWDTFTGLNPGWGASAGIAMKYFNPITTPVFDLTDSAFIQSEEGDDPVVVTRSDLAEAKNVARLDYADRYNYYNSTPQEVPDDNAIELYGRRVDRMAPADEFTLSVYARISAQLQLNRYSVRNTYTFRLGMQYCVLEPMDIVTITDPSIGLDRLPVRITSIEEDERGILTFVCEEFRVGIGTATAYPGQDNLPPPPPATNVEPGAVNEPFIFEPTAAALTAFGLPVSPTLSIGVSAGPSGTFDPNWGGCNVFTSEDDLTYVFQGSILGPSRQGSTTAMLPAFSGTNPDNVNTLSVDLSESNGVLDTVTPEQAAAGLSVCALSDGAGDIEFLSYTTATLVAPNVYDLTGLYRGLFGTVGCAHGSGSKFLRVDPDVFDGPLPPSLVGHQLYVKLQSFNIFNQMPQDISTCVAYPYTPLGLSINLAADPILAALSVGVTVDLDAFADETLDLNAGGGGDCAPVLSAVDLN